MKSKEITMTTFKEYLAKLSEETALLAMDEYIQHGETSCFWHSVAVAYYSVRLAKHLGISCDVESLITGALLHDYFLYDWHIPDKTHRLHGFTHPNKALFNAQRDWKVNDIEMDIIRRHMFPLTPIPPMYREGVIVCIMDKYCSIKEIIQKDPYKRLKMTYAI
nr:HD domain-containing protein [uncultured Cellulosilyticum sp.]